MREPLVVQTDEQLVNRWWQLVACVIAMMAIANTWGLLQGIVVMVAAWFMRPPPAGWQPTGWEKALATIRQQVHQSAISYTPLQMLQSGTF